MLTTLLKIFLLILFGYFIHNGIVRGNEDYQSPKSNGAFLSIFVAVICGMFLLIL
jgi:hypothetical protein